MKQESYWDKVADSKTFTTPLQWDAFAHIPVDSAILDVGCGYGRILNELSGKGYRNLTGVDFSEQMIARGKKLYPQLDLRKTTSDLDFEDNSFDAVTLIAVLTCIADDKAQLRLLKDIHRVLRPGGFLYINDFLINSDERNLKRYNEFREYQYGVFELPDGALLRHHDRQWVRESLSDFETLNMTEQIYTTMNGNKSAGYCFLGRK